MHIYCIKGLQMFIW